MNELLKLKQLTEIDFLHLKNVENSFPAHEMSTREKMLIKITNKNDEKQRAIENINFSHCFFLNEI